MRTLNPTEEGIMAFAMVRGLLDLLVKRGFLGGEEVADLLGSLANDLSRDFRSSAKLTPEVMRELARPYRQKRPEP